MKKEMWIEKLRVLATVAVIFIHVVGISYVNEPNGVSQYRRFFDQSLLMLLSYWAVPVFLMITGYLLLNPEKDISSVKIIKYVKRMLLVLLIFGLIYCLIESFVKYRNEDVKKVIPDAIINLLTGNSWDHMWYIYMLIGIYILTPIIRAYIRVASDKELKGLLIVLFVMTIIVPSIGSYTGIYVSNMNLFYAPYVFYYLFGYSVKKVNISIKKWIIIGICGVMGALISIVIGKPQANSVFAYNNICIALIAMSLFSVSYLRYKTESVKEMQSKIIEFISKRSFCIYLVHPFFLNILVKVMHIYSTDLPIVIGEAFFWGIAMLGSLIAYEILSRLPIIKKII